MKTDSRQRYGSVTRRLHWVMAVCYLFMFGTAVAWRVDERLMFLVNGHKAVGFVLMVLALVRFVWAIVQISHRPPAGVAARLGHLAMHVLMLMVPAFGIARQAGQGRGNEFLIELGDTWHGVLAWSLLVLVMGHVAMTVFHQIRGQPVLQRMLASSGA